MTLHVNIGERERTVSGLAATALAVYGLGRGDRAGLGLAAAGGLLALRALSGHCPAYRVAGIDRASSSTRTALGGSRGVHVLESIAISRPVEDVYRFWRDLSNLPRFMRHLQAVRVEGPRSHWVARAPLGMQVEWDAEIINEVENKVIGWRSLDGAQVANAGSVNFEGHPGGRDTEVRVKLQYDPPAGRIGAAFARLFGEEPSQQIREDLSRLKGLLESGARDQG